MIKRLSSFLLLAGLISLALFFTSNTFVLDASWFFIAGLASAVLGSLVRRVARRKRSRPHTSRRNAPEGGHHGSH